MLFIYVQKLFAHCFVLYSSVSLRDAKENIYYFTWRSHIFDTKLSLQCHLVPKRLAALKKEFHSLAGHAIKKTAHPAKTDNKEELRAKDVWITKGETRRNDFLIQRESISSIFRKLM